MFKFCCEDCGECWYVGNPRTCKCPDEEPNKKWVGLTIDEISELVCNLSDPENRIELGQKIESKLKEKNHGN